MKLSKPTPSTGKKINAAALGGAFATLLTWGISETLQIDVPAEVGVAFGVICTFVASLLIPDASEE